MSHDKYNRRDGLERGAVEVRLLGPVEVYVNGQRLEIRTPMHRLVLAVLVTAGGQLVTIDGLIDKIWDAEPPESARDLIYEYVSKLRGALRRSGGDNLLPDHRGGYRALVHREEVDLHRFTDLAAQAGNAAGRDDKEAIRLCQEALRQWPTTGGLLDAEAFVGLSGRWAANFRPTLAAKRRRVLVMRLESELRLGYHDDTIPELKELISVDPPDEQVARLLMLALYRAGRQAEALEVYPLIRRRLVERGVDPSKDLGDLHQRIARQDPTVDDEFAPTRRFGGPGADGTPDDRPRAKTMTEDSDGTRPDDGSQEPRLFVSYAHGDFEYARRLCAYLATHGLPVWYDVHLVWGEDFVQEIPRVIRNACGIIVLMSPESAQSRFVSLEILEGQVRNRDFLPVLLSGDPLFLLRSTNYFDSRGGTLLPGDREIRQLREFCAPCQQTRPPAPPFTVPPPPNTRAGPFFPPPRPPSTVLLPDEPAAWLDELARLLARGQLGHADLLTTSVILQSVGRLNDGWMRAPDGKKLPLPLLAKIDDIWREGSQGRFGFARQLALQNRPPAGVPPGGGRDFFALADRLRWRLSSHELIPRRYSHFIASTRYPYGYPDAFFPTLRNVQVEESMGWLNQWRQSVMATHVRLRREGGLS